MMLFWILCAAMILVALAIIAPALLKKGKLETPDRDQQNVVIARERLAELQSELGQGSVTETEYEQAKLELEQALLLDLGDETDTMDTPQGHGKWALVGSVIIVSLLSMGIYLKLGVPELVDPSQMVAQQTKQGEQKMPSVEEMITALTARLKEAPEDTEGWYLLGRTYMVTEEFKKAEAAFERLYKMVDDQPSIMLALADASTMANGGDLKGRPTELIRKAITLAPNDPTALWLAGLVEDQAGQSQLAIDYWTRLQGLLSEEPESLQRVNELIEGARSKLSAGDASAAAPTQVPQPAAGKPSIQVHVSVAEPLLAKVNPNATLFVYARAENGPRMPLAAVRLKASDLPAKVVLDDSTAMTPATRLSGQSEVLVGALLSSGGNASAAPGDLRGEIASIAVGTSQPVELRIDTLVE